MKRPLFLCLALLLALAPHDAEAQTTSEGTDLPVQQVILYKSGVGYVEHTGTVRGDRTVTLRFPTEQISDVLKSLVVQDAAGSVQAVGYPSKDPLARTLESYAVDLSGTPSLGNLLNQLRGADVTVILASGGGPDERIRGTVMSAEEQQARVEGAAVEVWTLNLLSGGALRSVRLDRVRRIALDDPELQDELDRALQTLAEQRDRDLKPMRVRFEGEGARRVRLGYITEAPVWKTSYRLLLPDEQRGQADLQGWAIVENQTDADWENVRVGLVSGRPVSFVQPLYEPRYVDRPVVEAQGYRPVTPQRYQSGVDGSESTSTIQIESTTQPGLRGTVRDASTGDPIPGANVAISAMNRGTATDRNGQFTLSNLPPGRHTVEVSFTGYQSAQQSFRIERGGGARAEVRLAPSVSELGEVAVTGQSVERRTQATGRSEPVSQSATSAPIDASAGVEEAATGATTGEVFRYDLGSVSIERQRSAMVPIVTRAIEAQRVSIYNASVLKARPLRGARFQNTTGLHLAPGPVTVLDAGVYAGDARLPYVPPGEDGLLSYAVDLDTRVQTSDHPNEDVLQTAAIADGVLRLQRERAYTRIYTVENNGDDDRRLILEHARRAGTDLEDPSDPLETTADLYRFALDVEAGETETFTVREVRSLEETIQLLDASPGRLAALARGRDLPGDVREALEEAVQLQQDVAEAERAANRTERELSSLTEEQERIRSNMETVEAGTAYYERLLSKLEAQEDQIEQLREQLEQQQNEREAARQRLRNYLRNLNVQ